MVKLSQRDNRWGYQTIGWSSLLIRDYGCTITCLSMILGTTPDVFNRKMRDIGGFSGALIIWSKVAQAFPGITVYRYFGYNNDAVRDATPNVLVEVPAYPIGGLGRHWVVYVGNQRLYDPWTGLERPTSDFPNPTGYSIVRGIVTPPPLPPYTERQALVDIKGIAYGTQDDSTTRQRVKEVLAKIGV